MWFSEKNALKGVPYYMEMFGSRGGGVTRCKNYDGASQNRNNPKRYKNLQSTLDNSNPR